jgi:hypothetical protein
LSGGLSEATADRPAPPAASKDRKGWGGRSVLVGLALFAGLSLARQVVVDGWGDWLASRRPQQALALGRDSPDVLSAVAEGLTRAKHYDAAARLSLAALARSPLTVRALGARAMALAGEGRSVQADALMRFAGTRSWRDNVVQAWLLRDGLERRDYGEAFVHADALARRHEALRPVIFELFALAAADSEAADALAARLALRPNWREAFLDALARSRQRDAAVGGLFQRVDRGPAPLSMTELGDYPGRLARAGRYRDAFQALASYRGGREMAQTPFDGDFTDRQGVAPFVWDRVGKVGVTLDFAPAPDRPGGDALRVDYDGFSSTDLLRQAMALEPGDYRLTGEIYEEAGDARQLGWEVRCIADGRKLAAIPASPGGPAAWRPFGVTFTTPDAQCDGVWLVLTGAPGERRSTIVVWYDKIRVSRVAPPAAGAPPRA